MGISGLLIALKTIQVLKPLSEFSGKTIAVDAYGWLHKGVYSCATELATGKNTHKYVDYAMHRVRLLRYHGIEPYIVFDGGPLPAKKGTESERKKRREDNCQRGKALLAQGKHTQARECFVKSIDVTPQMAYQFIKALRAESVPYVVAPYEADAQMAYLERIGLVDAILTEDSDLLVFGCQNVLFKLDPVANTVVSISRKDFGRVTASSGDPHGISLLGWSDVQFRAMTILSGCDYLSSIPGIGLKTACSLLRKWKTPEQVVKAVALEGKKSVPPSYFKNFQLAEKCFLHQRVYCPLNERLVHLTEVGHDWNEVFDAYVGGDLDAALAKKIAEGEADPSTYEPMDDINKAFIPRALKPLAPGPASNSVHKSAKAKGKMRESTTPTSKPRSGGILNFFGPNAIIPPQSKQPKPAADIKPKPSFTGKASGKRTLAEVMEQDMSRKKKARQSYSPSQTTQSKFFPLTSGSDIHRRHSDGGRVLAGSATSRSDKENVSTKGCEEEEGDASQLSVRVAFGGDGDDIMEFDLTEFPDVVEQEDGYISPSPSYSKEADELSSPPPAEQPRRPTADDIPHTGYIPSDEEDEHSFGAEIVSSPVSVKRPSIASRARIYPLQTPTRPSTDGSANVLVNSTPTPLSKHAVLNEMDEIPSPTFYRGPDLRSMLDDDGVAEHELEEALEEVSAEPACTTRRSRSTSPSLSPETPVTDTGTQSDSPRVVIDVDGLGVELDEEDRLMREAAERATAVMKGWRERWALPAANSNDNNPRRPKPDRNLSKAGSRTGQLKRSETNVTPTGRHSLARAPKSAPPKFKLGSSGNGTNSDLKGAASKPRRSLTFESLKQTSVTNAPTKARHVVDLTVSDPLDEDDIVALSSPEVAPRDSCSSGETYDIFAQAHIRLSQFRYSR